MTGIWPKDPVEQNPSPLPSTRLPPLLRCGSFSLRIIFLYIMNLPTDLIGSFTSLNTVWNVFSNVLILQSSDLTEVWNQIKFNAGLWMPQSVTHMPTQLQAFLEEASLSMSHLKSPNHTFRNTDPLASTQHYAWPDLIMKGGSINLDPNVFISCSRTSNSLDKNKYSKNKEGSHQGRWGSTRHTGLNKEQSS